MRTLIYNPNTDDWEADLEEQEAFHHHQAEEEYFNGLKDTDACEINNPSHYTVGGHEAIDVIKAKLTPEEYRGYCKGNVLKYIMRANYKGHHDKDVQKADYYMCELYAALSE